MIIHRSLDAEKIFSWLVPPLISLLIFNSIIAILYYKGIFESALPWLPVSVIATAVAFYTGFKNNQSYDRMWEARKIWGGIVNDSRSWGMMIDAYISNLFQVDKSSAEEIYSIKKRLVYRHIAWLYAHRRQLLQVEPWEPASQRNHLGRRAKKFQKQFGIGLLHRENEIDSLKQYLPPTEYIKLQEYANTATQIIHAQSEDLQQLREKDFLDDFRIVQLEELLRAFYGYQGKNERIKKFPFPRQYALSSTMFVYIFILLLPFSMIPELLNIPQVGIGLSIAITTLVAWIFVIMEQVGDYSENPFQGASSDIPMLSLCRTIEIDLLQMLKENDIPPPIQSSKRHIALVNLFFTQSIGNPNTAIQNAYLRKHLSR